MRFKKLSKRERRRRMALSLAACGFSVKVPKAPRVAFTEACTLPRGYTAQPKVKVPSWYGKGQVRAADFTSEYTLAHAGSIQYGRR